MIDPALARARIEIACDRALIKKLTTDEAEGGPSPNAKTRARVASLQRLIAANKALLQRLTS